MPFTMPLRLTPALKAVVLLCPALALTGCASMDGGLFPSFSGESEDAKPAQIASQPVDPLNVDPLNVDPLNAPSTPSAGGSQMVPLGTLNSADMAAAPQAATNGTASAPKRNGPAPLIPQTAQTAVAPTPAPAAPAATPAAQAPVLTPPPGMTPEAEGPLPSLANILPFDKLPRQNINTTAAKAAVATSRAPVEPNQTPQQAAVPPAASAMMPGAMAGPEQREFMPQPEAREFVPAQITLTEPMTQGAVGAPKLTVGDSNIIRRFQILSRLLDEGLITQDEHDRRRAANAGALLQYSKEPPGLGLDRPVPAPAAISARLQALGRSLEMRAITSRQHELERTTILNSLLPEKPDPRAPRTPPPADMFALADAAGRLAYIRDQDLISEAEFDAEKAAMDRVMRGGEPIEKRPVASSGGASGAGAAKPAAAKPAAAVPGLAPEADPAAPQALTGPVLHLASFRSAEGARSGFEQAKARNPQLFASLRYEPRKTNVPGQGNFYRLLVGPFGSLAEAEAACVEMKKVDQFCRPTPDGS
ncbi:MAG: SPOR domain-containing protein [Rhodospirillaceae bacterium]|nr:SPOR domain-containing protein [Rhodospirillaceae bacterium]